jgi:hypothetical protein
VTTPAVADQVDHDIPIELLTVREGVLGHAHDSFGVVTVHVEDRRLDGLRDVGGVDR